MVGMSGHPGAQPSSEKGISRVGSACGSRTGCAHMLKLPAPGQCACHSRVLLAHPCACVLPVGLQRGPASSRAAGHCSLPRVKVPP